MDSPGTADPGQVALVAADPLFDAAWYCRRYPAAAASDLSPAAHYLVVGAALGYDPGPGFSTSRYLVVHADVAAAAMNPLVHYASSGRHEGRTVRAAPITIDQRPTRQPGRPCVLVVGHLAGAELFGAERSLIDLLDGFLAIGIDTVVALPRSDNHQYLDEVERRCTALRTLTRHSAWPRRPTPEAAVTELIEIIVDERIDAVHANTVLPHEALLAASRCDIPAVLHAREIPFGDPALHEWLGLDDAQQVVAQAVAAADHVIATSRATAAVYMAATAVSVVPNIVDTRHFDDREPAPDHRVRVALVGSTTARKGLLEFVAVARLCAHIDDVVFVVVGPDSPLVRQLQAGNDLPSNLEFRGYSPTPAEAMAQADIVVNLSLCQESFARTLLEAMAAGLPVVAYAQGGTPEVVRHGETGFLVPFGDQSQVAAHVTELVDDPALRRRMGAAGRRFVIEHHSPEALAAALASSYRAIQPDVAAQRQSADDLLIGLPAVNNSPFLEPFYAGNRARFARCSAVRFIDEQHVVTCSLLGREMHLVRLRPEQGVGEIIATLPTTDGARGVSVDLLDFDGDRLLLTSNCEFSSMSLYRVEHGHIEFLRAIPVDAAASPFCHGAAFIPGSDVLCAAVTTVDPGVRFIAADGTIGMPAFTSEGWLPKSVAFVGDLMVVTSMNHNVGPSQLMDSRARVALVELDATGGSHRILDTVEFPGSIMDGCHAHDTTVYVADQASDVVRVLHVAGGRLRRGDDLRGFSLPHDVAVSPSGEWLAVANYGTNQLRVRRLASPGARQAGEITPQDARPTSPAG